MRVRVDSNRRPIASSVTINNNNNNNNNQPSVPTPVSSPSAVAASSSAAPTLILPQRNAVHRTDDVSTQSSSSTSLKSKSSTSRVLPPQTDVPSSVEKHQPQLPKQTTPVTSLTSPTQLSPLPPLPPSSSSIPLSAPSSSTPLPSPSPSIPLPSPSPSMPLLSSSNLPPQQPSSHQTAPQTNIKDSNNDERASDSGSSAATEADNSEDEHVGGPLRERQQEIPLRTLREREDEFNVQLYENGLRIVDMRPDGNCLFRSLAYIIYGDAERHGICRSRIMQYLVDERDYFSQFVAEDFSRYVRRKKRDGTHGNHLELQAAAELYGKRIEVYSYSNTPITIIDSWTSRNSNESNGNRNNVCHGDHQHPIRLSFHRGCHYNAVVSAMACSKGLKHNGTGSCATNTNTSCEAVVGQGSSTAAATAINVEGNSNTQNANDINNINKNNGNCMDCSNHNTSNDIDDELAAWRQATEDEVERAVLALSLIEATRGTNNGSGSSAVGEIPSGVLALVNSGYSEELANEAYRVAGHAGLAEMVRYLTSVAAPAPMRSRVSRQHRSGQSDRRNHNSNNSSSSMQSYQQRSNHRHHHRRKEKDREKERDRERDGASRSNSPIDGSIGTGTSSNTTMRRSSGNGSGKASSNNGFPSSSSCSDSIGGSSRGQ